MRKILAAAFIAAFAASPLLACDAMKGTDTYEKMHGPKAELKTDRKAKTAKASKPAKPLAEGKTTDKKI